MSDRLILEGTEDTPSIHFEREKNAFKIAGRSYPENAREFFEPIVGWLTDYASGPNPNTNFEVNLEYVNSGSVKGVFRMLYIIEDIMEGGNDAKITWYYKSGDELMHQKGLEFQKFLQVQVDLVEQA